MQQAEARPLPLFSMFSVVRIWQRIDAEGVKHVDTKPDECLHDYILACRISDYCGACLLVQTISKIAGATAAPIGTAHSLIISMVLPRF